MVAVSGSAAHGSGGNFLIQSGFSEHSQSGKIGELLCEAIGFSRANLVGRLSHALLRVDSITQISHRDL